MKNLGAFAQRIVNMCLDLLHTAFNGKRPDHDSVVKSVTAFGLGELVHQEIGQFRVHATLDVYSVRTDARLTGISDLGSHQGVECRLQIAVVKNDEG